MKGPLVVRAVQNELMIAGQSCEDDKSLFLSGRPVHYGMSI